MGKNQEIQKKIINIRTLAHVSGGLYVAVSRDLPHFSVAGTSPEEIEGKLERAIREFLELSGHKVISVELVREELLAPPDFGPPAFIAHAALSTLRTP